MWLLVLLPVSALIGVIVPKADKNSTNTHNVTINIALANVIGSSSCPGLIQPSLRESSSSATVGFEIYDLLTQGVSALLVPDNYAATIATSVASVPVISYDDGQEALQTPLAYRVTYSTASVARNTAKLISHFGWTKVILLCSVSNAASGACQDFVANARASKVYVASTETIQDDGSNIEPAIVQAKRSKVRIVVLWVTPDLVFKVLLKAHELSMSSGFQWIGDSAVLHSGVAATLWSLELNPSTYRIFSAFTSFLVVAQPAPDPAKEALFRNLWLAQAGVGLESYSRLHVNLHDAFVITASAVSQVCNLSSPDLPTAITSTPSVQTLRTSLQAGSLEPLGLGPMVIENLQDSSGFSIVGYCTPSGVTLTSSVVFPAPNSSAIPTNFIQSPCSPSLPFDINYNCNKTKNRNQISVVVLTHAPIDGSSGFWNRFASGLQVAAFAMRVNFTYLYDSSIDGLIALLQGVIANPPDGVILSLPNAARLQQPLIDLLLTGVDVVTVNTGINLARSLKPLYPNLLLHVGQNETAAGAKAGQAFLERGVSTVLFALPTLANDAYTERMLGLQSVLQTVNGSVTAINVQNSTGWDRLLRVNPSVPKGVLTANGDIAPYILDTYLGQYPNVVMASFDAPDEVLARMDQSKISFVVYQQPWLQGFLPLNIITLAISQRNWETMELVETGGLIVNSAARIRTGENPTEFQAQRYAVITTGVPSDSFWKGFRLGIDQAAVDFRATINYDYFYSNSAGSYAIAFNKLLALTGSRKLTGLIVDFGDPYAETGARLAIQKNIPVVGVFRGESLARSLQNESLMLGYVGVDDVLAGKEAARRLIEEYGATNLMMINFSPIMPVRFAALAETFESYGFPWIYWVSDTTATDFANYQNLESTLRADVSIDAIFSSGNFHIPWYQQAATVLGRQMAMAAGTLGVYTQEVYSSRLKFGINQQEYIMGYIPVRMLSLFYAISLSKTPQFSMQTGPAFVTIKEVVTVECSNLLKRCPLAKICAPGSQFITPVCEPCPPGTYENNGNCTSCPPGTFQPSYGAFSATQCQPCIAGTRSDAGASMCNTCLNCSLAFTLAQSQYVPFNPLPPPSAASFSSRAFFASLVADPTLIWLFRVLLGLVAFIALSTLCTFVCCRRRLNRLKMFDQTFKDPVTVRAAVGEKSYGWPDFLEPPKFPIGGVFSLFVGTVATLLVIAYIVYMTRRVKEETIFAPLLKLRPEEAWLSVEVRILGTVPCDGVAVNTSATIGLISPTAPVVSVGPGPSECSIYWEFVPFRSLDRATLAISFSANTVHQFANYIAYRLQTVNAKSQTKVEKIGKLSPGKNNVFSGPVATELTFSLYHSEFEYLQDTPRYGIIMQELAPLLGSTRSQNTFYADSQSLSVKVNLVWADLYEKTTVSSLSDPFTLLTQIGGLAFYWQLFMVVVGSLLMKYVMTKVQFFKKYGGGGDESNRASIRYLTHFGLELAEVRKENKV